MLKSAQKKSSFRKLMAERTAREPASRRSATGRWKTAAGSRAEHGDVADVDFDVVLIRASES